MRGGRLEDPKPCEAGVFNAREFVTLVLALPMVVLVFVLAANKPPSLPLAVKLAFIARYTFRFRRIEAFGRSMAGRLGRTVTWTGAMKVVSEFNAAEARKRRGRRERRASLRRNAGSGS